MQIPLMAEQTPTYKLALLYWRDYAYKRTQNYEWFCRLCQWERGTGHVPGCIVGEFEKETGLKHRDY